MKNILIFVTIAAIGIVVAYYLVVEPEVSSGFSDYVTD